MTGVALGRVATHRLGLARRDGLHDRRRLRDGLGHGKHGVPAGRFRQPGRDCGGRRAQRPPSQPGAQPERARTQSRAAHRASPCLRLSAPHRKPLARPRLPRRTSRGRHCDERSNPPAHGLATPAPAERLRDRRRHRRSSPPEHVRLRCIASPKRAGVRQRTGTISIGRRARGYGNQFVDGAIPAAREGHDVRPCVANSTLFCLSVGSRIVVLHLLLLKRPGTSCPDAMRLSRFYLASVRLN